MNKKDIALIEQARDLTSKVINRTNAFPLDQAHKNAIVDPMSEVLAILAGLLFKAPK